MKHDYHGKPASLSARLMRVARRYKREDRPERRQNSRLCRKKSSAKMKRNACRSL